MSEKQWDEMIRVNLKSVYSIIHSSAIPTDDQAEVGKDYSDYVDRGAEGRVVPHALWREQGGVISLVKGLAVELARHNILVNSVAPGWVATDMSNPVIQTKAGVKAVAAAIPLGRPATAEEIAGPILFLASDLANFLTGEIINVNGGSVLCG